MNISIIPHIYFFLCWIIWNSSFEIYRTIGWQTSCSRSWCICLVSRSRDLILESESPCTFLPECKNNYDITIIVVIIIIIIVVIVTSLSSSSVSSSSSSPSSSSSSSSSHHQHYHHHHHRLHHHRHIINNIIIINIIIVFNHSLTISLGLFVVIACAFQTLLTNKKHNKLNL